MKVKLREVGILSRLIKRLRQRILQSIRIQLIFIFISSFVIAYFIMLLIIKSQLITNRMPFPLLIGLSLFFLLFYLLTQKKVKYIESLADGLREISTGNLDYRVPELGVDELGSLGRNINQMTVELKASIEEERKAEKTKNELITNVSHDIRTPLTLIIGYLRALKDKKFENEAQQNAYLDIAYEKSERLILLLEDLFEYTKLANDGVTIEKKRISLMELLEQLIEEYVPLLEERNLIIEKEFLRDKVYVEIDPDLMVRVFENLLHNGIKYSKQSSLIRIRIVSHKGSTLIQFQNQGDLIPDEELSKLFERFYRLDPARSSVIGGSGLGLAISKSIVELHGGRIWADNQGEMISFNIEIN